MEWAAEESRRRAEDRRDVQALLHTALTALLQIQSKRNDGRNDEDRDNNNNNGSSYM